MGGIQVLEIKGKGTHGVCLCDGGKRGFILLFYKMEKVMGADAHSCAVEKPAS